jgi:hypothetical protein
MRKIEVVLEVAYINVVLTPLHPKTMFPAIFKEPLIKVVKVESPIFFQFILGINSIALFLLIISLPEVQTTVCLVLLLNNGEVRNISLIYALVSFQRIFAEVGS